MVRWKMTFSLPARIAQAASRLIEDVRSGRQLSEAGLCIGPFDEKTGQFSIM